MNVIEQLAARIEAIEKVLGIESSLAQDESAPFWDPHITERDSVVGYESKVVFKCKHGHQHDDVLEAKSCQEAP